MAAAAERRGPGAAAAAAAGVGRLEARRRDAAAPAQPAAINNADGDRI